MPIVLNRNGAAHSADPRDAIQALFHLAPDHAAVGSNADLVIAGAGIAECSDP